MPAEKISLRAANGNFFSTYQAFMSKRRLKIIDNHMCSINLGRSWPISAGLSMLLLAVVITCCNSEISHQNLLCLTDKFIIKGVRTVTSPVLSLATVLWFQQRREKSNTVRYSVRIGISPQLLLLGIVLLQTFLAAVIARHLLLSGDVEENPGPRDQAGRFSSLKVENQDDKHLSRLALMSNKENIDPTQSFDWANQCFICGMKCFETHRSSWCEVQPASLKGKEMFSKISRAAKMRNDEQLMKRLQEVKSGDLSSVKAKYHHRGRACYTNYVRHLKDEENENENEIGKSTETARKRKAVIETLAQKMETEVIEKKKIWTSTTMKDEFVELAHELQDGENTRVDVIKRSVQKRSSKLSFVQRPGKPDIIYPSNLTVQDAVKEMSSLQAEIDSSAQLEGMSSLSQSSREESEDSIVYKAACILNKRLKDRARSRKEEKKHYPAASKITVQAMKEFVDPLLLQFIAWIVAPGCHDVTKDEKVISIACDITSKATGELTPKHIGLSVYLHHEFGSRKLIETVSSLGHCLPYWELLRFITSAALHIVAKMDRNTRVYIPPGVRHKDDGGRLLVGVADNWDHKTFTIDGKKTTHAMTSMTVTSDQQPSNFDSETIPRQKSTTLDKRAVQLANLSAVIPYHKPDTRPRPPLTPTPTVDEIKPDISWASSELREVVYTLLKSELSELYETCDTLTWHSFHVAVSRNSEPTENRSVLKYNPMLMANPTNEATIFTTLTRFKECASHFGHSFIPVVFDMGLLTKALEIVWARQDTLSGVIPIEGGFHLLLSVFAAIGVLYGDAGLESLYRESSVFAPGTARKVVAGDDYERCLYGTILTDEVMHRLLFRNFNSWCDQRGHTLKSVEKALEKVRKALNDQKDQVQTVLAACETEVEKELIPLLEKFRNEGRSASPTFQLWNDFLQKVTTPLKNFIAAARTGNWPLYQRTKCRFLPLLFATNRNKYSKYMTVQILQMKRLPDDILRAFNEGDFVAKLSEGTFNKVCLDYVLETTQNKELKGKGGIIGLTLKEEALARWFLARPITAMYSSNLTKMTTSTSRVGDESQKWKSKTWNENVEKMLRLFEGQFLDPFRLVDAPSQLTTLGTRQLVNPDVQDSLLCALENGQKMAEQFVQDRLIPDQNGEYKKSFYDTLPRNPLKKIIQPKDKPRKTATVPGVMMYLRLMSLNSLKKVPLKRVMSFENSTVPLSMFSDNGAMHSCMKSHFMQKLEEELSPDMFNLPQDSMPDCVIFDGFAVIHSLPAPLESALLTFRDQARFFLKHILQVARSLLKGLGNRQIHILFDRYLPRSIKNATRAKRNLNDVNVDYHVDLDSRIPSSWSSFLNNSRNKAKLAALYCAFITSITETGRELKDNESVIVSGGDLSHAVLITNQLVIQRRDLSNNHEEADTMIVLHAAAAAQEGCKSVIVDCQDTDVLVLLLHHHFGIKCDELFFRRGIAGNRKYVPVHQLYKTLNKTNGLLKLVLPLYCLSGCDTTSAFYGHAKRQAYKLMKKMVIDIEDLSDLGSTQAPPSKAQVRACTCFVAALYGNPSLSLNDIRCMKAIT